MRTLLVALLGGLFTALIIGAGALAYADKATGDNTVRFDAGRTNVHSGGRLHGSANKRVGCGGCSSHPASYVPPDEIPGSTWAGTAIEGL